MSAALPAFQLVSDLGPSPSREQELEELCCRQAEQHERLQDLATKSRTAPKTWQGAINRPEEKKALLQLLSDFGKRVEDLDPDQIAEAGKKPHVHDCQNCNLFWGFVAGPKVSSLGRLKEIPAKGCLCWTDGDDLASLLAFAPPAGFVPNKWAGQA